MLKSMRDSGSSISTSIYPEPDILPFCANSGRRGRAVSGISRQWCMQQSECFDNRPVFSASKTLRNPQIYFCNLETRLSIVDCPLSICVQFVQPLVKDCELFSFEQPIYSQLLYPQNISSLNIVKNTVSSNEKRQLTGSEGSGASGLIDFPSLTFSLLKISFKNIPSYIWGFIIKIYEVPWNARESQIKSSILSKRSTSVWSFNML